MTNTKCQSHITAKYCHKWQTESEMMKLKSQMIKKMQTNKQHKQTGKHNHKCNHKIKSETLI